MPAVDSNRDLTQRKKALRAEIVARRDALSPALRQQASKAIVGRLLQLIHEQEARTVMAYASAFSEVETVDLISTLLHDSKHVILPRVNRPERRLDLYRIKDMHLDLQPGTWGIPEPVSQHCELLADTKTIDMVIVPGVAFTLKGQRLGYGGGYYDKLLGNWQGKSCFIAPAFDEQVVEDLPCDVHDIKVHGVITPAGLFDICS